jgi:DNA replication and repair protein RecF
VEHSFSEVCQRYQRLLKQRNAALKQRERGASLQVWERELAELGEKITLLRQQHLAALMPFIEQAKNALLPTLPIQIEYEQGWKQGVSLATAISQAYAQDERWGYTSVGPHRADITFTIQTFPAQQVLSRGQQKLLICALHLAQAQQLAASTGKKCLYLLDDLASELDSRNRQRVLAHLAENAHQVFITGVDPHGWAEVCQQFGGEMFHVEHGQVVVPA